MRKRERMTKMISIVMAAFAVLLFFVFPVSAESRNTPVKAQIPIICEKTDATNNNYEIVIENIDNAPLPDNNVISFSESGQTEYEIEIDEPGTYLYKVYEKAGTNKNIIYDNTSYTVTIFVTQDDNGVLNAQVILSKDGAGKPTSVKFVNMPIDTDSGTQSNTPVGTHNNTPVGTHNNTPSGDSVPYAPATGEAVSKFYPYAVATFMIGSIILILALKRRKEETDG